MKELTLKLRGCPLFNGIDENDLAGMLVCLGARTVSARKEQPLFREGDPAIYMGIVLTGSVQIVREDYFGNRSIMAHIGPKHLFGEAYAFSGTPALPVSVIANEDTEVLLLDSRLISACCSNACSFHNQVIFNLLHLVAVNNLILHQKIQITAKRTTRDKLMAYLFSQAKRQGSNAFTIPYDRQELADYLEVDRSGLSAEISKLRREGILESEKNHFRLLQQKNVLMEVSG